MEARQLLSDLQACADSAGIKVNLRVYPTYLGSGTFAKIYSVLLQGSQGSVAVKLIDTENMNKEYRKSEIRMMAKLTKKGASAHGIMPYFGNGYNQSRSLHAIFMPDMVKGALTHWLQDEKTMNFSRQVQITYGIACGLSFLRRHKVVHRDIKPDNILLNGMLEPIIADFGFATILPKNGLIVRESKDSVKGTPIYMAPEILAKFLGQNFCYSSASDVYAAALVIWQIFSRKSDVFKIYPNVTSFAHAVVRENCRAKMPSPTKCPEPIARLITWGWAQEREKRPTPKQMEAHLLEHYKNQIKPS